MKIVFIGLISVALFSAASCSSERSAITTEVVNVFSSETEAAYEGSLNKEAAKPIAKLDSGTEIRILRDTYGKDYWVCKVELENDQKGWLRCTSIHFQEVG